MTGSIRMIDYIEGSTIIVVGAWSSWRLHSMARGGWQVVDSAGVEPATLELKAPCSNRAELRVCWRACEDLNLDFPGRSRALYPLSYRRVVFAAGFEPTSSQL